MFKTPAAGRDVSGARRLATRYRPAAARSMVPAVFPLWEGLTAGAHPEGADPTDGIFYLAVAGYPSDLLCPTMQSGELPVSSRRLSAMVQSVRPQLIIAIRGPAPWRRFSSSHPAGPPRNSASFFVSSFITVLLLQTIIRKKVARPIRCPDACDCDHVSSSCGLRKLL